MNTFYIIHFISINLRFLFCFGIFTVSDVATTLFVDSKKLHSVRSIGSLLVNDDLFSKPQPWSDYAVLEPVLSENFPRLKTPFVQDLTICHLLISALQTNNTGKTAFSIDSDTSHFLEEYSISHWLQRCGIEAPVVYMYHRRHQSASSNKSDHQASDSYCTVRSISGLTLPHRDRSRIDGFNCIPTATGCNKPTCLEDFMNYQVISRYCESVQSDMSYNECLNSQEVWSRHNFKNLSLHFFSSWGLMQLIDVVRHGSMSTSTHQNGVIPPFSGARLLHSHMVRDDLFAVAKAFSNIGSNYSNRPAEDVDGDSAMASIGLVVHSLALPFSSPVKTRPSKPLSRLLLALMLVYDTDAVPAAAYTAALQALSDRISTDHLATVDNVAAMEVVLLVAPLLDALMQLFGTDFRMFHNTCRRSAAGEVPMNYICRHRTARQQLAELFTTSVVNNMPHRSAMSMHFQRFVDMLLLPQVDGQSLYPGSSKHTRKQNKKKAVLPEVSIQIDGGVDVLIFVRPEHVHIAQRIVYHWQRHNAAAKAYFLYLKFLIIPMYPVWNGPLTEEGSVGKSSGGVRKEHFYTRKPSLDAVLNAVAQKIVQLCCVKDMVYVLVGLQAVLSLPQPGRLTPVEEAHLLALCREGKIQRDPITCDASVVEADKGSMHDLPARPSSPSSCMLCNYSSDSGGADDFDDFDVCAFLEGVIPAVDYDETGSYRLDANIVFSASQRSSAANGDADSIDEWIGVYAFLGVGYKVLDMINTVRADPRYPILGSSNFSAVAVPVEQLLREYVLNHPADATVDCQQRAFHTTKSARLIDRLVLSKNSQGHGEDAINAELQNPTTDPPHQSDSLDSIYNLVSAAMLKEAGLISDSQTQLICAYSKYRADLSVLLDTYLWNGTEAAFAAVLPTLRYKEAYFGPLSLVPVFVAIRSYIYVGEDQRCAVNVQELMDFKSYINASLYKKHHLLSAVIAVAGGLHQTIACLCEYVQYAVDELVYIFTRIGILSKHVTYEMPYEEYEMATALLEAYEQRLVGNYPPPPPADLTASAYDWQFYSNMPALHRDQILAAVRFALSGMKQEMAVYPDMVKQMEVALTPSTYQQVQQRRALWLAQTQQLSASLALSRDLDKEHFLSSSPISLPQEMQQVHVPPAQAQASEDVPGRMAAGAIASASSTSSSRGPRTHYVTYASEHKEGLQNLLDSAALAGIHIEVLGLGEPYRDYSSKTEAYLNYLLHGPKRAASADSNHTRNNAVAARTGTGTTAVSEDDVVLLMDAYDVLVFPSVQRAASVLAQAPTPLLFCADRGIYAEVIPGPYYQRGAPNNPPVPSYMSTRAEEDQGGPRVYHYHYNLGGYMGAAADGTESSVYYSADSQKFINSGCILGRAGQVVDMLRYTRKYGRVFRDDQLMLARYMLENPGLASIDSGNSFFVTNFRTTSYVGEIKVLPDLRLMVNKADLGLIHCNHIESASAYYSILAYMRAFNHTYYQGPDGGFLLEALQLISTGRKEEAVQLLQREEVVANCTTRGGANPMRNFILARL